MPPEVEALVSRYRRESRVLQSDAYGEADTRKEFIEPLFVALGWDVSNTAHHAEAYKDVVNEYSLKVGTSHKAPDYAFRVGGNRTFFVEAKRPGVDISKDKNAAYQLRRYGWTAKLPISVLTNFRHLAIYDCTRQPGQSDAPSIARTLLVSWDELAHRWGDIEALLGKTSVYQGSLDRYASQAGRRRGTAPVDEAFLIQMEQWRELLARNLARNNHSLTVAELNEAVQQTLDRLIFLRIAEDRGIEPYESLKEAAEGPGVYESLMEVFRAADTRYNSGLFHFKREREVSGAPDTLTPSLTMDDVPLRSIVKGMYYPSPYEFSVLPADILGQVYEQFLGKVIRLTPGHLAKIEEKPEVRRAGGVYYTPTHIVNHIVGRTLGQELEGKTPKAALNLRIVDPACGSGSFLIGAFDYLLHWFTEAYKQASESVRRKTLYRDQGGELRLTLAERRKILTSCIYGVDIDRQAVEVTKLSLMLKVLEGESNETMNSQLQMFHVERALPDLNRNIQCGNSLVGPDIEDHLMLTPDDEAALNPFSWATGFPTVMAAGGFHVVIGNPPYDVLEKERGAASWPHSTLRDYLPFRADYVPALGGKLNLYRLFLVRALALTRTTGRFGMIVPMGLAADISTAPTRKHMLAGLADTTMDCFPQKDNPHRRVFKDAKLSTLIIAGTKLAKPRSKGTTLTTKVFPGNDLSERSIDNALVVSDLEILDPEASPVPLMDEEEWTVCRRIHAHPDVRRLGSLTDSFVVTRGEINQTTSRDYITESTSGYEPLLKGVEVAPFRLRTELSQGRRERIDADRLLQDSPRRRRPPSPRLATQRITGVDERSRLVAAIVTTPCWFADSTNSISPVSGGPLRLEYLVALLNSDLMQWRFRLTSTNNNVGTNELEMLPIVVNGSDAFRRAGIEAVASAGRKVAASLRAVEDSRSPSETDRMERKLDVAWSRLNKAVYDLYDLSLNDRALIASRLAKPSVVALAGE